MDWIRCSGLGLLSWVDLDSRTFLHVLGGDSGNPNGSSQTEEQDSDGGEPKTPAAGGDPGEVTSVPVELTNT